MITHNSLESALENPKEVKRLTIHSGKTTNLDLFNDLHKLVNLEYFHFAHSNQLKKLPPNFFKLPKLKVLSLQRVNLTELPEEIANLVSLERLNLNGIPLKKLPASIGQLSNLVRLVLRKTKVELLPTSIGQLKKLHTLHLEKGVLKELPDSIGDLESLQELKLTKNNLVRIPDSIGKLSDLMYFYLDNNKLESLPNSLSNLTNLIKLHLGDNQLKVLPKGLNELTDLRGLSVFSNAIKKFPVEICECVKLEDLHMQNNQLTQLPKEFPRLKNLQSLKLKNNAFREFPELLLDWYSFSNYSNRWQNCIDPELYNRAPLTKLLSKNAFKKLSREDKLNYFHLFIKEEDKVRELDEEVLCEMLNSKLAMIADRALDYLTQQSTAKFQEGNEIVILGKTSRKKSELIEQLKDCGLNYSTQISPNTKQVLISSRNNKGLDKRPKEKTWDWITEAQLIQYLDKIQPSFLMEEQSSSSIDQIVNLIMTLDEENMALALELITGGGLPLELLSEVFIVYKLSEVKETQSKARKLLEEKAPVELLQVIRSRTQLNYKNKRFYDAIQLKNKLKKYIEKTALNLGKVAYALYLNSGNCIDLVLDYAPSKYCKQALENITRKNNVFKLYYQERLMKFPMELLEIPKLTSISIRGYRKYRNKEGKLIDNDKFILPKEISKLENLEELMIYPICFESLPIEALCTLKKLKYISLKASKDIDISPLREALPDCKINIRQS